MIPNPFASDIFPDGFPLSSDDNLTQLEALEDLEAQVQAMAMAGKMESGRVVQLKAPRAGFGKSHLLGRLQARLEGQALVLPVAFDPDKEFRWSGVFWEILQLLHGQATKSSGLTHLDELGRRLFARLNKAMIRQGRVPCAEPENAVLAMDERALELFDLSNARQPVGRWFAEHFERLLPGLSTELAAEVGISDTAAGNWLRILCSYTQGLPDAPSVRFENLRWAAQQGHAAAINSSGMQLVQVAASGDSYFKDRLAEFGRLASLWRPLVFIFDDLDAVHGSAEQAVRLATVMTELRRLLPRTLIVFSVNQDLWTHTFQKSIPSALEDRLTGGLVQLGGLGREDAEALLHHRLMQAQLPSALTEEFYRTLNLPELFNREPQRVSSPRSLLRLAARAWDQAVVNAQAPTKLPPGTSNFGTALQPGAKLPVLKQALDKFSGIAAPVQNKEGGGSLLQADGGFLKIEPQPTQTPPQMPPVKKVDVWKKCQELRVKLSATDTLKIDQDIFCHLLEAGGRHLTIVNASHVPIPGSPGPGALRWHTPDGEIYFGTESHADRAYWRALVQHVREKRTNNQSGLPQWLVIFLPVAAQAPFSDWLDTRDNTALELFGINMLRLEHSELASIYAVDEVLHESEHADGALPPPPEVFTALSPLVEVFWNKVTRPLA